MRKELYHQDIKIFYYLDENNFLHHDSLPAMIIESAIKKEEYFFYHGILYRANGPALKSEGKLYKECFHQILKLKANMWLISEAIIFTYHQMDTLTHLLFNSPRHRNESLPALIQKIDSISSVKISYYKNDLLHREDGPALIRQVNEKKLEKWYLEGKIID